MTHDRTISVVGLGYVGLPVAIEFAKASTVIAYDHNPERIAELRSGVDRNKESDQAEICLKTLYYTDDPNDLKRADFHIVAVPTPVDSSNQPYLKIIEDASIKVAQALKKGDIVVYESTVYPGTTEEFCVPILEQYSQLKCNIDFFVGYSPERINPADKERSFKNIKKIVSGSDPKALEVIAAVYQSVVNAGVFMTSSIKVAETAKVIENTQRDLNIALMNELAIICHRLKIDTDEVLKAAGTKWNFLPFRPGLVGGHCIGVDPYYLTHKAEQLGYHPEVILAGRRINDNMGKYITEQMIKYMIKMDLSIRHAKVGILGITFKENCRDIRNSKVIDIITELQNYGVHPQLHDPIADPKTVYEEYGLELSEWQDLPELDVLVIAVAHEQYKQLTASQLQLLLKKNRLLFDIKAIIDQRLLDPSTVVWRL